MTRPTYISINTKALEHNLAQIRKRVGQRKVVAMVKANAYGCGIETVIPALKNKVDAWGVACMEEALTVRKWDKQGPCILFQGVFTADEVKSLAKHQLQCVIHQQEQLNWLLKEPLEQKIKIWVKVDTGMHRLGFAPEKVHEVLQALEQCPWIDKPIGLMTHLACADQPHNPFNQEQLDIFQSVLTDAIPVIKSIANSAAILALPQTLADAVRPGIMLYGISPFPYQSGQDIGLRPVMHFKSALSAIHNFPPHTRIGYGQTWQTTIPSRIGVVAAGYGDGYPRHVTQAQAWIDGVYVPIVGRISMDMLTVDLTNYPFINLGMEVELWGENLPVEQVAQWAGTSPYELICQIAPRVRR